MWNSFVSVDDDERWQLARGYHLIRHISVSRHARCTSLECSKRRAKGAGAADDAHRVRAQPTTCGAATGRREILCVLCDRNRDLHRARSGFCPFFSPYTDPPRTHARTRPDTRKPYATGADRFSVGRARTGRLLHRPAFSRLVSPHSPACLFATRGCPPVIFTHLRWHSIMRPRGAPARRGNQSREESQGRKVSQRRREGRFSASCHRPRSTGRGRAPWQWRPRSA